MEENSVRVDLDCPVVRPELTVTIHFPPDCEENVRIHGSVELPPKLALEVAIDNPGFRARGNLYQLVAVDRHAVAGKDAHALLMLDE